MSHLIDDTQRRAVPDRPALRRVTTTDLDEFARTYWGLAPLLTVASAGTTYLDLFSLAAADELLSVRGLRTPFIRLAKGGRIVPSGEFTGSGGIGATIGDQVRPDDVARAYAAGATIVFQALHRNWPALVDFTQQLSTDLGHPVQVNGYLTPPTAQGFAAHYDTHDVFVIQVEGRKHWTIHEPVLAWPAVDEPSDERRPAVAARAAEPPFLETDLGPGDALYLPRGWLHSARAGAEPTLHLTFGVHPLTRGDVLVAIVDELKRDQRLRRSLPVGCDLTDPSVLVDDVAAVTSVMREFAGDPAAVAEVIRARLARDTRPEALRPIAQAAAIVGVDGQTRVRRRAYLRVVRRLARDDQGADVIELSLPDRVVRLPWTPWASLELLLSGSPTRASDLADLSTEDAIKLVRRLLDEAVLVPAD